MYGPPDLGHGQVGRRRLTGADEVTVVSHELVATTIEIHARVVLRDMELGQTG